MFGTYGDSYRRAIWRQRLVRGVRSGDEAAVGGAFEQIGAVEADLLGEQGFAHTGFLIDIGCGAGRLAYALHARLGVRYLGLDISPELLASAQSRCARSDWRFERVSRPEIPAESGTADAVTAFSIFTHVADAESRSYLREARRVLKPSGFVLFSFLDPEIAAHRKYIRPAWIEGIATRLAWAPNVATTKATIAVWAAENDFLVRTISASPTLGQSFAVLTPKAG